MERKTKIYLSGGVLLTVMILIAAIWLVRSIQSSEVSLESDDRIQVTPELIESIKAIGQWEFLAVSDEQLVDTIRKGIFSDDHLDLANNYGPVYGSAEETMGRIMDDDLRPYRDELFISTKAGYDMWPGPYGNWGSRKYLTASLDQSLKRMHLDYVDLFYSHRYDPETPLEETLQALVDVVRAGKALYVGISRWPLEATRFAIDYLRRHDTPLLIYQGRLNMLDREPVNEGILQLCHDEGVGFISFSPLAQGLLTGRYLDGIPEDSRMAKAKFLRPEMLTDELLAQIRQWNNEAEANGQTLAEMALRWILQQQGVTSVLVGASSTQQLAQNLRCVL